MDWDALRQRCRLSYKSGVRRGASFSCKKAPEKPKKKKITNKPSYNEPSYNKPAKKLDLSNKPTEKQIRFAVVLGIDSPESYTKKTLSVRIDEKISERAMIKFNRSSSC